MNSQSLFTWDRAKDLLTILVIPSLIWVSHTSTNLELLDARIKRNEDSIQKLEINLESQRQRSIETNERLARVETRLVALTERINELKQLLERLVP